MSERDEVEVEVDWAGADEEAARVHALLKAQFGGVTNGALALLMANAAVQKGVPLEVMLRVCTAAYAAHVETDRVEKERARQGPAS